MYLCRPSIFEEYLGSAFQFLSVHRCLLEEILYLHLLYLLLIRVLFARLYTYHIILSTFEIVRTTFYIYQHFLLLLKIIFRNRSPWL